MIVSFHVIYCAMLTVFLIEPPSAPRNVRSTAQKTSISISWSAPAQTGGRTDLFYEVKRSNPDNLGSYTDTHYTDSNYVFSDLRSFTDYCIRVTAHNGVSDQDPDGTHLRTVEECTRTLQDGTIYAK